MTTLPVVPTTKSCWQQIGIWGDRSCPELVKETHCHNCPVFATAGRRFLDAPSPAEYLDEWTDRLAAKEDEDSGEQISILAFRICDEWLALPVGALVEVTTPRTIHRVPHRGGLLSGIVNIRGELHLCVRLDLLLGVNRVDEKAAKEDERLVVIRREREGWVFAADEVDQVHRVPINSLNQAAPTLSRASTRLSKGVFQLRERSIGLLDDIKLFQAIRERTR